jgi:hypothetical protein
MSQSLNGRQMHLTHLLTRQTHQGGESTSNGWTSQWMSQIINGPQMRLTHLLTRQIHNGELVKEQWLDKSMDESKPQWTSNAFDSPVDSSNSAGGMSQRATTGQVNG